MIVMALATRSSGIQTEISMSSIKLYWIKVRLVFRVSDIISIQQYHPLCETSPWRGLVIKIFQNSVIQSGKT